jgi:hypothetical protein
MGMGTRAINALAASGSVVSSQRGMGLKFSGLGLGFPISCIIAVYNNITRSQINASGLQDKCLSLYAATPI